MKTKQWIIFSLVALLFASCYEDQGNYDYHDINEVTVDGLDKSYSAYMGITTLSISPEVTTSLNDTTHLAYEWRAVVGYNSSTLLATTKDLNYKVELEPGNYTLYFRVKDTTTGVVTTQTAALSVVTPYTKGLMIIGQDKNNATKVQMFSIGKDTTFIDDVLAGSDLPTLGEPVDIIHTGSSSNSRVWLLTSDNAYYLDKSTMKGTAANTFDKTLYLSEDFDTKFIPVDFGPRIKNAAGQTGSSYSVMAVTSNGYVFNGNTLLLGGAYYSDPVNHLNNSNEYFKASPCLMYALNAFNGLVVYDKDHERFVNIGSYSSYSALLSEHDGDPFPWNQSTVNRTFVYGENTFNSDGGAKNGNTFAIMKGKDDNKQYIYKFYVYGTPRKVACYEVSSIATDFAQADFYAFSSTRTVVYYAVGNKLYAYDYNPQNERSYLLQQFDGPITMLKCDTQMEPAKNPVYVATYNETSGGTLHKYFQGTNPDQVTIEADPNTQWSGLVKIKNMSWRATN